jgi:predicted transcriptional regulator
MNKEMAMPQFKLKATEDDKSHSIILSFHSKWYDPLREGKCSLVFRKTGPKRFKPDRLYAYLSAPISAVVARIPVIGYEEMPLEQAVRLAAKGFISRQELLSYAGERPTLVVYTIGPPAIARRPVTRIALMEKYDFAPSQTYIPVSETGQSLLDHLAEFE